MYSIGMIPYCVRLIWIILSSVNWKRRITKCWRRLINMCVRYWLSVWGWVIVPLLQMLRKGGWSIVAKSSYPKLISSYMPNNWLWSVPGHSMGNSSPIKSRNGKFQPSRNSTLQKIITYLFLITFLTVDNEHHLYWRLNNRNVSWANTRIIVLKKFIEDS